MVLDLRDWLARADELGELRRINGADWNLEIGCISVLSSRRKDGPAFLFDNIKDYPPGFRVATCSTSKSNRLALTLNLSASLSENELLATLRQKLSEWENHLADFPPEPVTSGPVLENIRSGKDIDLLSFPVPKWHELDGGRYIGTGDAVITRDPDTGETNLGTYRVMVHDRNTTAMYISPGKDGRVHRDKYHARGEPCPVAVSIGHHPLIFRAASLELPPGAEYHWVGAVMGEPVKFITEEITGLPIPADSEIVFVGWCPPGEGRSEGPFGEWTGYYASKAQSAPIINVERIYYRNDPIILGSPPSRPPSETTCFNRLVKSAKLHNELEKCGITDVRGVWLSDIANQLLVTISIKQRYAGHAKRAALIVSQLPRAAYLGRYVIVVDDDIDPSNINDVLWAMCTRSDPEKDIDIIRRTWSSPLDPMIRKPAESFFNSRAIIDACKPYEWFNEFPTAIEINPALEDKVTKKWGDLFQ